MVPLAALSLRGRLSAAEVASARSAASRLQRGDKAAAAQLRGLRVHAHGQGEGVVGDVEMHLSDTGLYSYLMALPYDVVHVRGFWSVLYAYHKLMMRSVRMETVCETVASEVRFIERRSSIGRDVSLGTITTAAQLRFAGLHGGLQDLAFLYDALCCRFKTKNPADFHFVRSKMPKKSRMLLDEKYALGPSSTLSRMRARDLVSEDRLVQMSASPDDHGRAQPLVRQDAHEKEQREAWNSIARIARSQGVHPSPAGSL